MRNKKPVAIDTSKMTRVKPDFNWTGFIFWTIIQILVVIILWHYRPSVPWVIGLPGVFLIQSFYRYFSSYYFDDKYILVKQPFEKDEVINIASIREIEFKKNKILSQIGGGISSQAIIVKYNRYSTVILFTGNLEIASKLQASI